MRKALIAIPFFGFLSIQPTSAVEGILERPVAETPRADRLHMAQGGTCRSVGTCREAVVLWCGGYRRADADSDGIPCENVCRSLSQVEAIKKDIGC